MLNKIIKTAALIFYSSLILSLFSCSDSDAGIISVNHSVVFDYSHSITKPELSLSLYVQTEHEAQRAASLKLEGPDKKTYWNLNDLVLLQGNGKQWAGYSSIKSVPGKNFDNGVYSVSYTDAAGTEAQTNFSVSYKKELLECKLDDFKGKASVTLSDSAALYDKDMNMLYFGALKSSWKTADNIIRDYNRAVYLRRVWHTPNQTMIVLNPVQNIKDDKFNETLSKK